MKLKHLFFLIILICYFSAFIFREVVTLDPDFGWHLQFGRVILKTHSIPQNDLYSYTMPSYHFVDHEWGTDAIIASLYDAFGMWSLNILFAVIATATLYFLCRGTNYRWVNVPVFLVGGTIFEFMGIRPQIISWMLLSLLMSVLWHKKVWQKWRYAIPVLFLLWADIHGGFAIGLVVLSWFVIGRTIEGRRIDKKDVVILFASIGATLINPYGYHLWTEVVKSAIDPNLRWIIQEWYPAVYFTNLAFWLYMAVSAFLVIRYRRKFSHTALGIYVLLFLSGMLSMRNIPIFLIVSFYPTVQGIGYLYEEAGKHLYGKERFLKGYIGFFIICMFLYLPQLGVFIYGTLSSINADDSYPYGAVSYLNHHVPSGNIFSTYDWGGFLIWELPQKKEFVDGRMPSWRNPTAPATESTYAFGDYEKILQNKVSFSTVAAKYHIDTILVSKSQLKREDTKVLGFDVIKNPFLKKFFTSNTSLYPVVAQVRKMGWKEVYQDKTAVVFEK
ncbi:MAG TPA: hypothetical protein VLF93_01320 [Candidatus Saccharimonadales bacterium]|nr:hypothetical protein [Candidatus Saccharimonadales bacterium]